MPITQFNQANVDVVATISGDGQHIARNLSFDDGTQKQLGCFLGSEGSGFNIYTQGGLAQRLQITQGFCHLVNHDGQEVFLRENQSFIIEVGASIYTDDVLQYVIHLEE